MVISSLADHMHMITCDYNTGPRRVSTTMTFRLDLDNVQKLREEAKKQGSSLNSLINYILRRYLEWDALQPRVGMITLPKKVAAEMFGRMSQDDISEIANGVGKNAIMDMSYFINGNMDLQSFLDWFESRMKDWLVGINHKVKGKVHVIIISHDLGMNWSLYYRTAIQTPPDSSVIYHII